MIQVTKRDGRTEDLNLDKIHAMLFKACEGLTGVSVSDIAFKAKLSFYNGMTTKEIHGALIKAAADLISDHAVNYQYVAGNLLNYDLRKTAWGGMIPPRLYDHIKKMVADDYYTEELLEFYTEEEWDKIDAIIDHDRDFKMTYIGLTEYMTKYAMRDRSSYEDLQLETPQITYVLISAICASDSKKIKDIKSFYNDFSLWNISLPTPIMAGLRSPTKQFSSCTLISVDDTLKSIIAGAGAIVEYASKKAGIGIDASRLRAEGAAVGRGKAIRHTGVVPFYRLFESALKSCSQGGVRGASATLTASLWHMEIEHILVLRNNKGTPDSRVRKLDYSIQINDYLYNRFVKNENITLFSPSEKETPGLYDAYFADKKLFAELYEKYEADQTIRKKSIPARELFASLMVERKETGRVYIFNVDNVNDYSTFKVPITTSNLCQEITLPTVPLKSLEDPEGQIALCTLAAINLGNVKSLDDLESVCRNSVRALDNILDYQDYMVPAAKTSTMLYRPLGVGITNLAYYLAKNGVNYSSKEAYELMHDTMEAISFYCIKASIELAKERGACPGYAQTRWSDGEMPIDRYNKTVDKIVKVKLNLDWKWLKEELKKYGIRNATLLAMMPAESSSRIFNSTNGVEPVRALITTKGNKHHITKQVVPEFSRLKNKYDMLWDMEDMDGVIKMMAVIQKFTCQSISTNLSYNPAHYPKGEIPLSMLLKDILKANKYGLKTLYYHNTPGDDEIVEKDEPEKSEFDDVDENMEESCDACAI